MNARIIKDFRQAKWPTTKAIMTTNQNSIKEVACYERRIDYLNKMISKINYNSRINGKGRNQTWGDKGYA